VTALPVSRLGATPWQSWVAEVGLPVLDEAAWAARTLAQAVLVALAWPARLAWLLASRVHWGTGEAVFCTVLAAGPVGMLVRLYPSVRWPTAEQALADLQHAAAVLAVVWLVLYLRAAANGGGQRACCAAFADGHRHLLASPDGTKTWRWLVSVHEAGHLVVGQALNRRTGTAKLSGAGGVTKVIPKYNDIAGEVAIDRAGRYAAGTPRGCEGDEAALRWRLNKFVKPHLHAQTEAAGDRLSRRLCNENRSKILQKAREIYDRGWTR
jgi:hypothetical protein